MAITDTPADYLVDFGVTVTKTGGATFTAIFDKEFVEADMGDAVVERAQPMLMARTADVSSLAKNATLTINAVAYTVRRLEDDGTGFTRVILNG